MENRLSTHQSTLATPDSSDSKPILIRLENVSKIYKSGDTELRAVSDVSLIIEQGEYCSIMGSSGSGKSTAMNLIGCLDRPTSGRYYLDEKEIALLKDKELAQIRNLKIGFVFQQFYLLPQLSVLENVMLLMCYANLALKERQERAITALQRVGLEQQLHNKPNKLSGGQQQRVAIARAIVNQPILLLADEPTGALDSHTSQSILNIFTELNANGVTVLVVTHDPEVARCTRRIIWFRDGQVTDSHQASLSKF